MRIDRCALVGDLHKHIPSLKIFPAVKLEWERHPVMRATKGCSLSHLDIVRLHLRQNTPVFVLEDDAVVIPYGAQEWNKIKDKIPQDAGIVLLGAETENYSLPDKNGFREVQPKTWGSHAVLYMPLLLETNFLAEAYRIIASNSMGETGFCYESVLHTVTAACGVKMYRPSEMVFTTAPSFSDRTSTMMQSRTQNLSLPRDTKRIIHQFWEGDAMPELLQSMCNTWKIKNPECEYRIWNVASAAYALREYPAYMQCIAAAGKDIARISDITRWFLLYKFGGWYFDTDFECIKPIGEWDIEYTSFISAKENADGNIAIGAMYAEPECDVIKTIIQRLPEQLRIYTSPSQTLEATGPAFLTNIVKQSPNSCSLIPFKKLYPFDWNEMQDALNQPKKEVLKDVYACHYWWGTWVGGIGSKVPHRIDAFMKQSDK